MKKHLLLIPLVLWLAYGLLQTIPMSAGAVGMISEGSQSAYTGWVSSFLSADQQRSEFPISIAVFQSRHALAFMAMILGVIWAAVTVFHSRNRIIALLGVIAVGAACHSIFAMLGMGFPDSFLYQPYRDAASNAFGTFVNKNNAALLLNLGVACSLGMLCWRLAALTGGEIDEDGFEINDLFALVRDRDALVGACCGMLCATGLLLCGSRGGVVGAMIGLLLAMGWVRHRRGFLSIPVVASVLGLCVAALIVPLNLNVENLRNRQFFSGNAGTLMQDGRLEHWPDGFRAGCSYFPGGSGMGTYAYAYLPFNESSSRLWFHHADNLWLELFVEQGLIGIICTLLIVGLLMRSLSRLAASADPLDQGLRAAGWYCIGMLLASQCFDFGLIVPANLLIVSLLFAAIVSREVAVANEASRGPDSAGADGRPENDDASATPTRASFRSDRRRFATNTPTRSWASFVILLFVSAVCVIAHRQLRTDAENDYLLRRAEFQFEASKASQSGLANLSESLQKQASLMPVPDLLNLTARVERHRSRLTEVYSSRPVTVEAAQKVYEESSVRRRRLTQRQTADAAAILESDLLALKCYQESLRQRPLGREARAGVLYLDFISRDQGQTEAAVSQLVQFNRGDGRALLQIATFTADSGDYAEATRILRSALTVSPSLTQLVLRSVEQWPEIQADTLLVDEPRVHREAAEYLLKQPQFDAELASRCYDGLDCDIYTSKPARAKCEALAARLCLGLGDEERGFQHYLSAVKAMPRDPSLRFDFIVELKEAGRRRDALRQAQIARARFSNDQRFARVIEQMAAEDIDAATGQTPSGDATGQTPSGDATGQTPSGDVESNSEARTKTDEDSTRNASQASDQ